VVTIRAAGRALVRWAVENPALAQLLYWRPVPGFAPTAATFASSVRLMEQLRAAFAAAVQAGQLHPGAASDEAPRLFTIVLSGLISQQMANEPGAGYDTGMFTSLTDAALEMFFARYALPGGPDADPGHDELTRHTGARPGTPAADAPRSVCVQPGTRPDRIIAGHLPARHRPARASTVLPDYDRAASRQCGQSRARPKTCQERRGNSRPPITRTEGDR
jgi:hypothetical protein